MKKDEGDSFWSKDSFIKPLNKEEIEKKRGTFHMNHNEEMNFNCKKCSKKISAHNKDWHEEMCDECFNKEYFPD